MEAVLGNAIASYDTMSNYPDFSKPGYQVIRELGRNHEGGRISYLATSLNTDQKVVIKQFCFALTGASWTGFKAYEREIQVLRSPWASYTPDCRRLIQLGLEGAALRAVKTFTPG